MTLSEIAELAGVNRSAVANWRDRHSTFPKPVAILASGPRYDRTAVKEWLAVHRPDRLPVPAEPPVATKRDLPGFIWSVADLLRGDYKQSEYGKVILPLTVLRRLDCVLEPTKEAGARTLRGAAGTDRERRAGALCRVR